MPGPKIGEKINDYWEPGRAMLTDPNAFLNSLMNFDKDSITEDMINKLNTYVNDPAFQPAKIAKVRTYILSCSLFFLVIVPLSL